MTPPLDAVPFEILVKINQHLTNQERYQLCLVNKSLNGFFKNYIFYSLSFHSVEQVISSCRRLTLEPLLFWKITTLSINVPFSEQCPFNRFLKFCQNLKVLVIGEQFWESLEDIDHDVDMLVDLDSYPVISTLLELDIACGYKYGIDDILVLFTKFFHIKRLTLRQLFLVANPSDIEQIHTICPELESLTLDHKHAFRPPLAFDALPPRRLGPLDTISPTMKHISIFHSGLWDEFIPWIYYIADKYPGLQSLEISFMPTWEDNHDEVDVANIAPLESAIRVLVDSCQMLDSVRFENIWWAASFFRYRFNKYHPRRQDAATLRQVSVVATRMDPKIATSIFNLISVDVLPSVTSLDLVLPTEYMTTPPIYMFQSFRQARVLTDLRLSTPLNRTTTTSLLWFLEFCPVLLSLVLDSGSIDVHLNDDRWMAKHQRKATLAKYQLKRLTLTNCIFTNDIFEYLEQTCPDLIQLSLTTCLLHRSPSLRLWFPRHVFRSIHINHVRVARTSYLASPSFAAYIDNPVSWAGGHYHIEFITIQRHHTQGTTPTYRLGPCYILNQHIFPTRSMKQRLLERGGPYQQKTQTFKVTSMAFHNQPRQPMSNGTGFGMANDNGNTTVMGLIPFLPFEFISTTKCMNKRELDYYGKLGCFPLASDSNQLSSSSPSESKWSTWTTTENNKRQKLNGSTNTNLTQRQFWTQQYSDTLNHAESSSQQQQQQQQQQQYSGITFGSHLLVSVYGITELEVNGKWMVL